MILNNSYANQLSSQNSGPQSKMLFSENKTKKIQNLLLKSRSKKTKKTKRTKISNIKSKAIKTFIEKIMDYIRGL